jgi:ribosomal protein S18 acetylase RimI-like enzyme
LNQRIVGEYVLLATRPQTAEIVNLAVSEDMQGRGIGRQLVLHAVELARQDGFKKLEIGTGNSSLGQLALYQKCGFRMASIDRNFFTRHYPQPIYENGLQCRDMVRLAMNL